MDAYGCLQLLDGGQVRTVSVTLEKSASHVTSIPCGQGRK